MKEGVWIFGTFVCLLLFSNLFISAEEFRLDNYEEGLGGAEKLINTLDDEGARSEYLKAEWFKILNNTLVGNGMKSFESFSVKYLDGVFEYILGLKFSWSFAFLLTFILWFLFLEYSMKVYYLFWAGLAYLDKTLKSEGLSENKFLEIIKSFLEGGVTYGRYILFILFVLFYSYVRAPKYLAVFLINIVSGKDDFLTNLIFILGLILILITIYFFSRKLSSILDSITQDYKRFKELEKIKRGVLSKVKDFLFKREEPESAKNPETEEEIRKQAAEQAEAELKGLSKEEL